MREWRSPEPQASLARNELKTLHGRNRSTMRRKDYKPAENFQSGFLEILYTDETDVILDSQLVVLDGANWF